jgi:hypothetical protein
MFYSIPLSAWLNYPIKLRLYYFFLILYLQLLQISCKVIYAQFVSKIYVSKKAEAMLVEGSMEKKRS